MLPEESKGSNLVSVEIPRQQKEDSKGSKESRWEVTSRKLSEIEPKKTFWLIENYLPLGELAILAGREGLGKSTLAVEIASQVTKGLLLEEPENVGYVAIEDSLERTVRTRFEVAGADLDRVHTLTLQREDQERQISFPTDYERLIEWVKEKNIKFLVLDPLVSVLSEKLDSHNDKAIRPALESIVRLAHNGGVTILGLVHINKGSEADFANRVLGSRAFSAVPRAILGLARDDEDPEGQKLLLGVAKSNLGSFPKSMKSFYLESASVQTSEGETSAGRVEWLEDRAGTIDERLGRIFNEEDHSERNEVREFLLALFHTKGEHTPKGIRLTSNKVIAELKEAGFSTNNEALKKHKRQVQVQADKEKMKGGAWFWLIPNCMFTEYYPEPSDSLESLDSSN